MVLSPEKNDFEEAVRGLEKFWSDDPDERLTGLRRMIYYMVKGCMTPRDFGVTDAEMREYGSWVQLDYDRFHERVKRYFSRKRGF